MTHQALTTYRALLDAAALAPYEFFSVWNSRESDDGQQSHVMIPTGQNSTMRLANCAERLKEMAEKVRTHWALFGGGPKPAELKPKPKRAPTWSARMLSVWSTALEEGHQDDVLRIALQHLGGRVYQMEGRAAFLLLAPQPVEGLPEQLQSWRRDDGKYVVAEVNTGHAVDNIGRNSRRDAERRALVAWEGINPDVRTARLAACAGNCHVSGRAADPRDALADWCKARGIEHQAPEPAELVQAPEPAPQVHQAEPVQVQAQHQAPEPAELVQAPEPGSVSPAGSPVPEVLTGAHVRRLMRAHGATIDRLSGALGVSRARVRQARERGLSGLPYVLDWLQGITGRAPALAGGIWWHDQGRPPGMPGPEPTELVTAAPGGPPGMPGPEPAELVTAAPGGPPGMPGPEPAELVTAAPGGPPGGCDPPMASPAPDYPITSHGFSVAIPQRFRRIQARAMRTRRAEIHARRADIRTRGAPMRTRWQALQPVQARAPVPCPGPAGWPGGRAGGSAPGGRAPPRGVAASAAGPPPGVAASVHGLRHPSPGCRGQCGRFDAGRTLARYSIGCPKFPRSFPEISPTLPDFQEFTP